MSAAISIRAQRNETSEMNRRALLVVASGLALARPFAAEAQSPRPMRRVGILMSTTNDPVGQARVSAFVQEMQRLGWTQDRDLRIDVRWGAGDSWPLPSRGWRSCAIPTIPRAPGSSAPSRGPHRRSASRCARSMCAMPRRSNAAWQASRASPNAGVVVTGSAPAGVHRSAIIAAAARHQLPAIYAYRIFPAEGGLISYGPNTNEPYARAPAYVDRILKGEKPADLPVQAPVKYEMAINLRTAKALGTWHGAATVGTCRRAD